MRTVSGGLPATAVDGGGRAGRGDEDDPTGAVDGSVDGPGDGPVDDGPGDGGPPEDGDGAGSSSRWLRVLVVAATVLAVLLLGAAIGLLVQRSTGGAATPGAGSVDVGFSQDMTVHHRQGVLMAGIARDRTTDPAISSLAFDIETNQLEQIGRMQGWLSLWDAAPAATGPPMQWMSGATGESGMAGMNHGGATGAPPTGDTGMPGMASAGELDALRAATGQEFDVLFLQLMLRHHQGAILMLDDAAQRAELAQVRNLANQMSLAQGAESEYLTSLLAERGAEPLPPPS